MEEEHKNKNTSSTSTSTSADAQEKNPVVNHTFTNTTVSPENLESENKSEGNEGLEDILDGLTEEELDKKLEETFKEDILSEDEVKLKFTHMNTAIVGDNVSTLKDRGMMPIENLEEKLKEEDEDEKGLISQEIIEYGIDEDESFDSHYTKPKIENVSYDANKNLSTELNLKSSHAGVQKNINSMSSEMAFVRKSMKSEYIKPKEFVVGTEKKKDNKFIQDFKKLSDDYTTQ